MTDQIGRTRGLAGSSRIGPGRRGSGGAVISGTVLRCAGSSLSLRQSCARLGPVLLIFIVSFYALPAMHFRCTEQMFVCDGLEWILKRPSKEKNLRFTSTLLALLCLYAIGSAAAAAPQKPLPYVAMHHPSFIPAAAATFLHEEDRVIGVVASKSVKAYPAAILAQHGLVEDESPDGPIAVTW